MHRCGCPWHLRCGRGIRVIIVIQNREAIKKHDPRTTILLLKRSPNSIAVDRLTASRRTISEIESTDLMHEVMLATGVTREDR
jgi:hypothetical protein